MIALAARQRGVAILTAMLVVALGTMIAVNLMWKASLDLRRTTSALAADQGLMYLQGAEAWAGDILRQDQVDSIESDHLGEIWAVELPPMPVDGGVISGRVEDLQGRFNINNLVTPQGEEDEIARRQFERLLEMLELDPSLAGVAVDWLDPDSETKFPFGAEDDVYSGFDPPYRASNTVITSPSELMAMSGFELESYRLLLPYVTALPSGTTLNVNTASDVLLASLSDDIDLSRGAALIEERGGADFPDISASFEGDVEPEVLQRIDGVSQYFLLTASVAIGTNQFTMYSVLQRDNSGIVRAIFRSLGVL
ncbi:MAG: type II secretion system minor pseudopilin GspK [Gammaproteobacteria bacterium]|jgi:general secretion pathway protein K